MDERYRAGKIELVTLQAKNSSGYQESVIEKLHFHLPALLDMGREEEDLVPHTNAKLLERTRRFLHILEELASSFPQVHIKVIYANKSAETPHPNVKAKGDQLRRELAKITSDARADRQRATDQPRDLQLPRTAASTAIGPSW